MKIKDEMFNRVSGTVGVSTKLKLEKMVELKNLPLSRLIAIAIDNELEKDNPFELSVDLPDNEYIEQAYVDEAGRLITFLKSHGGMPIEMLILLRHDMSIPSRDVFLAAFRECLMVKMIEGYKPFQPQNRSFKLDEDVLYYRVKKDSRKDVKRINKQSRKYETFQKLKKEFGDE